MKKFKEFTNYLKLGALGGIMTLLPCCNEKIPESPIPDQVEKEYKIFSSKNLAVGLNSPSGLSEIDKLYFLKSSNGITDDLNGILTNGATFQNLWSNGGIQPLENPKVLQFSTNPSKSANNLSDAVLTTLCEFDLNEYASDFDSYGYFPRADSSRIAQGVVLKALALNDRNILTSSNSSDKIFRTSELGIVDIFKQDGMLNRITDMIQASDGKIYVASVEEIDYLDSTKIIFPKRVISISPDGNLINTEFEVPSSFDLNDFFPESSGLWRKAPYIEKLKIIENSPAGKEKSGVKFYVSDLLKRRIYGVGEDNKTNFIAETDWSPYILGVDSIGSPIYATSPVWRTVYYNTLANQMSIFILNPETGESKVIHTFNETVKDYLSTGELIQVKGKDGLKYSMPLGLDVSAIVKESKDTLELLFTNSHRGTLEDLVFVKTPVEK